MQAAVQPIALGKICLDTDILRLRCRKQLTMNTKRASQPRGIGSKYLAGKPLGCYQNAYVILEAELEKS